MSGSTYSACEKGNYTGRGNDRKRSLCAGKGPGVIEPQKSYPKVNKRIDWSRGRVLTAAEKLAGGSHGGGSE